MTKRKCCIIAIVVSVFILIGCELDYSYDYEYSFYITEVSTSSSVGGLSVDYIELYNVTDEDIDLSGYYFGDSEGVDECHEVTSTLSINQWDSDTSQWYSDSTTSDLPVIPANGYLIVLYSNDFEIDEEMSITELETWSDGEGDDIEIHTVDDEYSEIQYLTVPEGLKDSKAEGVYIYNSDGEQATTFFTYEEDEQEDDSVFLYIDGEWTQGSASPGEANE